MQIKGMFAYIFLIMACLYNVQPCFCANITPLPPVSGRNPYKRNEIYSADVLSRVRMIQKELDLIKVAIGKNKKIVPIITVKNSSSREVYYEAQALFQKSEQLAYEVNENISERPQIPSGKIYSADVWKLVNAALEQILMVKKKLHIKTKILESKESKNTTPAQVFNAILRENQELNILLYKKFTPSDVFSEVTVALYYTQELLKQFPNKKQIIKMPPIFFNKRPTDVYDRLIQCIILLQSIAKLSGISILSIEVNHENNNTVLPSDVFDLSKIIVSEVRYFSNLLSNNSEEFESYYHGYKTPSDVYRRATMLLTELKRLKKMVNNNPYWLDKNKINQDTK